MVTLLVTPEQAEKLALAKAGSRLEFVLRNSSDEGLMPTEGSKMSDLFDMPGMTVESVLPEDGDAGKSRERSRRAPKSSVRRRAVTRRPQSPAPSEAPKKRNRGELVIGE